MMETARPANRTPGTSKLQDAMRVLRVRLQARIG
jgi:hypothetical protein